MAIAGPSSRRSDRNRWPAAGDIALIAGLLGVTALSIIALFGIVVLSVHVVGQVAPSAIAAISSISLAAITALGVVLRRRPPGRGGS